jgi:hypothetical protein
MKTIINVETGEKTVRELNAQELTQEAIDKAAFEERRATEEAEAAAKATAKASAQSKLAALGLTADEIAALSK